MDQKVNEISATTNLEDNNLSFISHLETRKTKLEEERQKLKQTVEELQAANLKLVELEEIQDKLKAHCTNISLEIREKRLESERVEFMTKHIELEGRFKKLSVGMQENENGYQAQITDLQKEKQTLSKHYDEEQAVVLDTMNQVLSGLNDSAKFSKLIEFCNNVDNFKVLRNDFKLMASIFAQYAAGIIHAASISSSPEEDRIQLLGEAIVKTIRKEYQNSVMSILGEDYQLEAKEQMIWNTTIHTFQAAKDIRDILNSMIQTE
ncbi:hypothetical protein BDY19DRAFT_906500 [Irpex rosettiformis]|uniref:Uncharacterized protein n=1 Tax=Irpex rosettiformis TaxID=378272 RepID=A0ACB8U277_9APHY|nr:hypothetical protein BDY19DRAFT_906500 [Irpex rosettiformis]